MRRLQQSWRTDRKSLAVTLKAAMTLTQTTQTMIISGLAYIIAFDVCVVFLGSCICKKEVCRFHLIFYSPGGAQRRDHFIDDFSMQSSSLNLLWWFEDHLHYLEPYLSPYLGF